MGSSSRSTVAPFQKAPLTPNCLAMKRAPSLGLMKLEKDISRSQMEVRFSLTRLAKCLLSTQARLLRVLENGEFIKVGSSKVLKTDVRVVAATNINLMKNVEEGKFREDLYYRLSTVPIYVPPLRERGKDIELLFRKFAGDFADKYKVKPIVLTEEAKEILLAYRFPGNIGS